MPGSDSSAGRRPPSSIVRFAVSTICIAATVWWLSKQPSPELPSDTGSWALIVLAAAGTMVTAALRGLRWSRILASAKAPPLGLEPYLLTPVGYMGNTVLPARGGDVLRVTLLSRLRGVDWKLATGTLIPERLLDLGAVATFLVFLTVGSVGTEELGPWPGIAAAVAILGAGVVLGAYEYLRRQGRMSRIADIIRPFSRPTRLLIRRETGPAVIALSFAIWLVETFVLWLVVAGTHDTIPFTSAMLGIVLVSLATAVPAAPGFLGTFDAAVIFGLHATGVPSQTALATAVVYRLVVFVPITLLGTVLLAVRYGGIRTLRQRPPQGAADMAPAADPSAQPAPAETPTH